jgi:hypothetical protein
LAQLRAEWEAFSQSVNRILGIAHVGFATA